MVRCCWVWSGGTEHGDRMAQLIVPFRDFLALCFSWFGLTIDPFALGGAVWPVIGAVIVTLIGNVLAVCVGWLDRKA